MWQQVAEVKFHFETRVGDRGPAGNYPLTGRVYVDFANPDRARVMFGEKIHYLDLAEVDELAKLCRKAKRAFRAARNVAG